MKRILTLLFIAILFTACNRSKPDYATLFEKSDYLETDNYESSIAYAKMLAKNLKEVNYETIGETSQGREIPMLIVDENGSTKPEKIRKSGKTVILIQACIHPGEPNGKDAGFMLIRDMLVNKQNDDLLKYFTILFIPVMNPDGLANFSPYHRLNQNGPKLTGWRVNAQGMNLNRDYTKLQTAEMQAFVAAFNKWQPDLFIDTHATDGADYQYVMTYSIEDFGNYDASLSNWLSQTWEPQITAAMAKKDKAISRYIEFDPWGDPTAALVENSFSAMFSESYAMARNCPGILMETHSLKPYKERVMASYDMIVETMRIIHQDADNFKKAITDAKKNDLTLKELPASIFPSRKDTTWVNFLGYEFKKVKSDVTGGEYISYDNTKPETRRTMKFRDDTPSRMLAVPKEYVIPAQCGEVIDIVKAHGFEVEMLKKDKTMTVNTYRFKDVQFYPVPSEGRSRVSSFQTEEISREVTFPKGSAVVKTSQNGVRLLMNLLEPEMDGSLLKWGFFNDIFQRTEYFEIYNMEPMAKTMMEKDPLLAVQFKDWMATFDAKTPPTQYEILNWFYERSPYYDSNYMTYPVGIVR